MAGAVSAFGYGEASAHRMRRSRAPISKATPMSPMAGASCCRPASRRLSRGRNRSTGAACRSDAPHPAQRQVRLPLTVVQRGGVRRAGMAWSGAGTLVEPAPLIPGVGVTDGAETVGPRPQRRTPFTVRQEKAASAGAGASAAAALIAARTRRPARRVASMDGSRREWRGWPVARPRPGLSDPAGAAKPQPRLMPPARRPRAPGRRASPPRRGGAPRLSTSPCGPIHGRRAAGRRTARHRR